MSNVSQWSATAASNNASPPDGWPENMARSAVNDCAREMMAALAKWYAGTDGSLTSGGGTTAYTLTTGSSHAALADIGLLVFRVNAANTGASTLAVDGLTAKSWTKPGGTALSSGDLTADQMVATFYNPNDDRFEILGASPVLNLNGLTTETAIATGDLLALVDVSDSNASEKITVANFFKAINAFSQETTIDTDADFLPMYDAGSSTVDKVTPDALNTVVALSKTTASSDSTVTVPLDPDNFEAFEIHLKNIVPATDGAVLCFRTREDGEGSFDNGASEYGWVYEGRSGAPANLTGQNNADTEICIGVGIYNSGRGMSGSILTTDAGKASVFTGFSGLVTHSQSASIPQVTMSFGASRNDAHAIDALQFFMDSGDIASGDFIVYGIREPR